MPCQAMPRQFQIVNFFKKNPINLKKDHLKPPHTAKKYRGTEDKEHPFNPFLLPRR